MNPVRYNIYCDESCHLEHDNSNVMILGAIKCLENKKKFHNENIRQLKVKHGMTSWNEIKWVKLSASKLDFYEDLIDYFLENDDISFRVCVAPKNELDHKKYAQTHDIWYYKMYYNLLKWMIGDNQYSIFLDIKDTVGGKKVSKLTEVLVHKCNDYSRTKIKGIYQIPSHESELLQLADLFIGALGYYHRGFYGQEGKSHAKSNFIDMMRSKMSVDFSKTSCFTEYKFNIFIWQAGWGRAK